jgi:hypothetical protein
VDVVRAENALLGALIEEAEPVALTGQELTVAFAAGAPFLKKKAESQANRAVVTAALQTVTGARYSLCYALGEEVGAGAKPSVSTEEEWVRRLMEEFDAEELSGEWPVASEARGVAEQRAGAAPGAREGG